MSHPLDSMRRAQPRFLLLYSPLQFGENEIAKPDGSLSLAYVAGALRDAGYEVKILDCSVGDDSDNLQDTFFRSTALPSGLFRVGLAPEQIAKKIADYDVIGVTSIFCPQTTMVLDIIRLVKEVDPNKLVVAGGVNARSLRTRFFANGVDVIALSEAEGTIVQIAEALRGKRQLTQIPGIAFQDEQGQEILNRSAPAIINLDELPIPAWDMLPLKKYWDISRPHGGQFPDGERIQYASLQTSRGCPYQCLYCHISKETEDSISGDLGKFRLKSIDRVIRELELLKSLGVEYVFFEDDSLFAKKKRAYKLFDLVKSMDMKLLDVNGINIAHLQKNYGGRLGVDKEFIEILADAGFGFLTLPFESSSQRLLDKYSTSKWHINTTNTAELLKALEENNIRAAGNYMIGYPDETEMEIQNTVLMGKRHIDEGLNHALFFSVVPFPGSKLFDMVIANGQLDADFDPDTMRWTKSILQNLAMPAETLERLRQLAWLTVNRTEYVDYKIRQRVDTNSNNLAVASL
jgi:anaerobic magnesium-protoporphyrin IX monomethyl ester cyclase